MANIEADRFIELIRLSQTVEDSALDEVLSSVNESVRSDSEKLSERLIADGLLTRWQCDHLLLGKHKGFRICSRQSRHINFRCPIDHCLLLIYHIFKKLRSQTSLTVLIHSR